MFVQTIGYCIVLSVCVSLFGTENVSSLLDITCVTVFHAVVVCYFCGHLLF